MKKNIKHPFSVICVSLLFIVIAQSLRYLLIDDTTSYARLMMHELHDTDHNIDVLFVGSSHAYRSFIPSVIDKTLGLYTFNAGTSAQRIDGSLAIIQEALRYHHISHVYLEVYYMQARSSPFYSEDDVTSTYIISDYMRPSLNKALYLLRATTPDHYINSVILARRNWELLFDPDSIMNIIKRKSSSDYRNYTLARIEGNSEYYVERGFVANESAWFKNTHWNSLAYGPLTLPSSSSDWYQCLQNIIALCKRNKIELTLVSVPIPVIVTAGKGNYDDYYNQICELCAQAGIEYYDFNLVREEYFPTLEKDYFLDSNHLNLDGAELFSSLFARLIANQIDKDALFYPSFKEKLEDQAPSLYGIAGPQSDTDHGLKRATLVSNRETGLEYRIQAKNADGEIRLIQDYSENKDFSFPIDETGVFIVDVRLSGETDALQTMEAAY